MSSCLEATSACIKVVIYTHCPATPVEPPAVMWHIIPALGISMDTTRNVKPTAKPNDVPGFGSDLQSQEMGDGA